MREETEFRPKPMVEIGGKPVLWHIMKIYASFGHTDFVICAGYKGDQIKQYFYNYAASNMDFTVTLGNHDPAVFHGSHDEFGWTVTVADTGMETPTGGRIKSIEPFVDGETFMCTYGDGIANVDLDKLLQTHRASNKTATMTVAKPQSRFGVVQLAGDMTVRGFLEKPTVADPVNIGFFVFEPSLFSILGERSVLEQDPLTNLSASGQLVAHQHEGYWQPMDTYREYLILNELWQNQVAPWKSW